MNESYVALILFESVGLMEYIYNTWGVYYNEKAWTNRETNIQQRCFEVII